MVNRLFKILIKTSSKEVLLFLGVPKILHHLKATFYSICVLAYCSCTAQKDKIIYQSFGTYKQSIPGIATYETALDGKEKKSVIDTIYSVYLNTSSDHRPSIDSVFVNNVLYNSKEVEIPPPLYCLGNLKDSAKAFCLKKKKGFTWWRLDLYKQDSISSRNTSQHIRVKGHSNKKPFQVIINKFIELESGIRM